MMAEVTVSGLKELQGWLSAIETKGAKKIAKQALTKAAEPIVVTARSLAPHKSGRLAGSIKIRPGGAGQARKSRVTVRVGTSAKDNAFSGDEFYAPMLEYGYLKVPTYREGNLIKSMPRGTTPLVPMKGLHFMTRAAEAAMPKAVEIFATECRALLVASRNSKI
jgi:HK97 gp10 family phage protein